MTHPLSSLFPIFFHPENFLLFPTILFARKRVIEQTVFYFRRYLLQFFSVSYIRTGTQSVSGPKHTILCPLLPGHLLWILAARFLAPVYRIFPLLPFPDSLAKKYRNPAAVPAEYMAVML